MKKITLFFFLLIISFNSYSQEKSIINFTRLTEGTTYISEEKIELTNLVTKGDSIIGYTNYNGKKIYFSKDNGKNWSEQKITIKNDSSCSLTNILWVNDKLYIFVSGDWFFYIYSSNDFGKTWSLLKDNFIFEPNEIYYNKGLFILRTLGKKYGELSIDSSYSGVYVSNNCKEWRKVSAENVGKISDVWLGKDEYYVISTSGLYKATYTENILSNITNTVKSKFDIHNRRCTQLEIINEKFYFLFENKLEEYDLTTNLQNEIKIPEEFKSTSNFSINSNNGVLFLYNYNTLLLYNNDFFTIQNELIKQSIKNVINHSGGKGLTHLKFNSNQIILNGTLSFPFSAIYESNDNLVTNVSKVKLYQDKKFSKENIIKTQTSSNTNTKDSDKYEIKIHYEPQYSYREGTKYNFKNFKNIIATNNSFYSLIPSPPSGRIKNQQSSAIGGFFIKTSKVNKLTSEPDDNRVNLKTYNLNNDLNERNKIYKISVEHGNSNFEEITINVENDDVSNKLYRVPFQFELNDKGSIETFKVIDSKIGNGIAGFNAYSTFSSKVYLFIYDFKKSSSYTKIDLSKFSNTFKSINNQLFFDGFINGKKVNSVCFINNVIKNGKYTYVFIYLRGEILMPLKIDINNNVTLMSESIFKYSNCDRPDYIGPSISNRAFACDDGLFYLPISKGIVNYYKELNPKEHSIVTFYDSNLNLIWQKSINDLIINHIYESGNYIIVGGYTKTKGYIGYPNPRIIVINKTTKEITYDKVLTKKNGEVSYITLDVNGDLIFGIGVVCCEPLETDETFIPIIISAKLSEKGTFENSLFEK